MSILTGLMTTKFRQGDGLWYWPTMHKVAWFFDHVVICSLMINEKGNISNFKSPMESKLYREMAYDIGPTINKSYHSL